MVDYDEIIFRLEERIERLFSNENRLIKRIRELEEENKYLKNNDRSFIQDNDQVSSNKLESFTLQVLKEKSKTRGLKFHELSQEEIEYLSIQINNEYYDLTKADVLAIIDKINRLGNSSNQLRKENKQLREGSCPRKPQDIDIIKRLEKSVAELTNDNNRLKSILTERFNGKK